MTAPAANMPMGVWSKTQWVWPSITSTCGTRSLYFSGARDVNMSAGSDQCESASTTSMFSVAMIGTVTRENVIYNTANRRADQATSSIAAGTAPVVAKTTGTGCHSTGEAHVQIGAAQDGHRVCRRVGAGAAVGSAGGTAW